MKSVRKRLKCLEKIVAVRLDGPWSWARKTAEVEQCAIGKLSPEDQACINELFALPDGRGTSKLMEANPAAWDRYCKAFDQATREVPAPFAMVPTDRWV